MNVAITVVNFALTVPSRERLGTLEAQLPELRFRDLTEAWNDNERQDDHRDELTFTIQELNATTAGGVSLRATDRSPHLFLDEGKLVFAGHYYVGQSAPYVAMTQDIEPDMQDWFWPLTGEAHASGDKPVDYLTVGDHIVVAFPAHYGQSVTASLIIPTLNDSANLDHGLPGTARKRLGYRSLMPASWVFEIITEALFLP